MGFLMMGVSTPSTGGIYHIWKAAVPLKVKVFAWLATHDKTLSRERLGRRGWNGSQICEICRLHVETNAHIFLHCPFAIGIWEFFSFDMACILDTHIVDVFSLFQFSKFIITRQCWCILVLSILWSVWLNRNAVIFRRRTSNLASIFFQIFHFATMWAENILAGHTSATLSVSQAIQQLH